MRLISREMEPPIKYPWQENNSLSGSTQAGIVTVGSPAFGLQRPALEQVYHQFAFFGEVDREFDVNGITIAGFEAFENFPHIGDKVGFLKQFLEGEEPVLLLCQPKRFAFSDISWSWTARRSIFRSRFLASSS